MSGSLQRRKSVLAIVTESTEGTPVSPSAGTDFLPLQSGYTLTPSFETLENNEIRSSIGPTKPKLGLENPQASVSFYARGSGVEGQAPQLGKLLKSVLGSEVINSTQRLTTTGSTTSVIHLASGGSDFTRGMAMLLKDGTNGYSVRNVSSISTNNITLVHNVAAAPATGIGAGKCVHYKPLDEGQASLTLWHYIANGGGIETVAGTRVTSYQLQASAGQYINQAIQFSGAGFYHNPIRIAAADTKLDFIAGVTTYAATVTAGLYKDPHELASALQTSMNAQGAADTFTVTYSNSTGKFTIASSGSTFSLLWNTGTNTANTIGDKIGFLTAADDTSALTYTSDNAQDWAAPYTPSYDSTDPLVAKDMELLVGTATDSSAFAASQITIQIGQNVANKENICSVSGVESKVATGRTNSIQIVSYLSQHDAQQFSRYRQGDSIALAFNMGVKSGGNWVAGKIVNICAPECVISDYSLSEVNGIVALNMTLSAFVNDQGQSEIFVNYL
jgi:hypothetical protein